MWEELTCDEWNSQVNKAAIHVGKFFVQEGKSSKEIKEIVSRFYDFMTAEENKS